MVRIIGLLDWKCTSAHDLDAVEWNKRFRVMNHLNGAFCLCGI